MILLGALCSAFALNGFLVPNRFFDGGVTGISLLLHKAFHVNIAYLIVAANLPFVVLAARLINRNFACACCSPSARAAAKARPAALSPIAKPG